MHEQGALASFLSRGFPGTQGPPIQFISSVLDQSSFQLYPYNHWPLPQAAVMLMTPFTKATVGSSLVIQWLWLHTPTGGARVSIPGQGTRSHMSQLRVHKLQLNIYIYTHIHMYIYMYILHVATKEPAGRNEDGRFHTPQLIPGAAK